MGIAYNTSIVRNGLVLHLDAANQKSYPGEGTNVYDLSISKNNGWLENSPTFNSSAFSYDGTNDRINFGSNSIYNLQNNMTLTAWIKPTATSSGNTIFQRQNQTEPGFFWIMLYGGKPYFQYRNSSGIKSFQPSYTVPINVWYMFTTVIDYPTVTFYVNSTEIASGDVTGMLTTTTTANLYFGSYSAWNTYWQYVGQSSVLKIYNRALSATEIKQNFEALRGRYGI